MIGEATLLDALEGVHSGRLPVEEAYRSIRDAECGLNYEKVSSAVGRVLFNTSNYPKAVQVRMIGQDTSMLRGLIVNAVMDLQDAPNEAES